MTLGAELVDLTLLAARRFELEGPEPPFAQPFDGPELAPARDRPGQRLLALPVPVGQFGHPLRNPRTQPDHPIPIPLALGGIAARTSGAHRDRLARGRQSLFCALIRGIGGGERVLCVLVSPSAKVEDDGGPEAETGFGHRDAAQPDGRRDFRAGPATLARDYRAISAAIESSSADASFAGWTRNRSMRSRRSSAASILGELPLT